MASGFFFPLIFRKQSNDKVRAIYVRVSELSIEQIVLNPILLGVNSITKL